MRSVRRGEELSWNLHELRQFTGPGASDRYDNPPAGTPPPPVDGKPVSTVGSSARGLKATLLL